MKFNLGLHDMMQVDLDNLVLKTPEEQPSELLVLAKHHVVSFNEYICSV